jgi:hypothetical protein
MDNDWVTLILLGLAAAFMPMVFGLEIYTLGENDGAKKVSGLLGGITFFRLLVAIGVLLLFVGVMSWLTQGLSDIGQFFGSLFSQLGQGITSGHHLIIDLLLVAGGVWLIIQAIQYVRRGSDSEHSPQAAAPDGAKSADSKAVGLGVAGMLGMGLAMSATNVNQWLFVSAAVNQILRMQVRFSIQLLAFLLFIGIATVMIALPLLIFLIRPQKAQADLAKINGWINGSMRYIVAGLFVLIGLYFIWKGGLGVANFFSIQ